jgi:uncharacterized protein (TIGR02246 family)
MFDSSKTKTMKPDNSKMSGSRDNDESAIRSLYQTMLDCWNRRNGAEMAAVFTDDASLVGFDGSSMEGRAEVNSMLGQIFAHHPTAAYLSIVRSVRFLTPEVAVLRAVVGMVPPGQSDLNPAINAVQTLVATKRDGRWLIAVFQNTPAAFHGRPELSEKLTHELRQALRARPLSTERPSPSR